MLLVFAPSASDRGSQRQLEPRHESGCEDRDPLALRLFEDGRFVAVLVRRDGGAKFRSGEPVPAPELFARIGSMPRRREAREKDPD